MAFTGALEQAGIQISMDGRRRWMDKAIRPQDAGLLQAYMRGLSGGNRFFTDFPDPRQPGKVIYPLEEVFLLCLLAVLAGAETVVDIARFVRWSKRALAVLISPM
jgi:hypothetical protein